MTHFNNANIAVIIPCYNEAVAIPKVIENFRAVLPSAKIYVYDNNSQDKTSAVAKAHGAIVGYARYQGKGNVVRRMFAEVDADIYILTDGDETYHAASAIPMIEKLIEENLDMVVGVRITEEQKAYRLGHRFGNMLFTQIVAKLFGGSVRDMLSGFRVFSRRYVKSFPALSHGFEIETELTVHALELRLPVAEIDTPYKSRPVGSFSKLNTYKDGFRILMTIVRLVQMERPFFFFSLLSAILMLASLLFSIPIFETYFETGLVPRLPTALLSVGLMLSGFLSLVCGTVLNSITRARQESKSLAYLAQTSIRS